MNVRYTGVYKLKGPLLFFKTVEGISFGETVKVHYKGETIVGRVISIDGDVTVIEALGNTFKLSPKAITVEFSGKPFEVMLSTSILGRRFNALGRPIDGLSEVVGKRLNVNGNPINPAFRVYPNKPIHTGISAVDGLNTLVRGQKLPVFSVSGVPCEEFVIQLVKQIKVSDRSVVILGAIGIRSESAEMLVRSIPSNGVLFISQADEPATNHILIPRLALTASEYLAFENGFDVVTILYDMTNYCEALREISSEKGEIPGRKGYPAYMYSDLASVYERAGMIKGINGSITQIPVLTMPDDDITNPIPDLTGYITEGQIVMDRDLHKKGIYPPISVLPSLSRLMSKGIGKLQHRWANQIYAAYARSKHVEVLSSIVGESELGEDERAYLKFGRLFEKDFLSQGRDENRSLDETMKIGWKLLSILPRSQLTHLKEKDLGFLNAEK